MIAALVWLVRAWSLAAASAVVVALVAAVVVLRVRIAVGGLGWLSLSNIRISAGRRTRPTTHNDSNAADDAPPRIVIHIDRIAVALSASRDPQSIVVLDAASTPGRLAEAHATAAPPLRDQPVASSASAPFPSSTSSTSATSSTSTATSARWQLPRPVSLVVVGLRICMAHDVVPAPALRAPVATSSALRRRVTAAALARVPRMLDWCTRFLPSAVQLVLAQVSVDVHLFLPGHAVPVVGSLSTDMLSATVAALLPHERPQHTPGGSSVANGTDMVMSAKWLSANVELDTLCISLLLPSSPRRAVDMSTSLTWSVELPWSSSSASLDEALVSALGSARIGAILADTSLSVDLPACANAVQLVRPAASANAPPQSDSLPTVEVPTTHAESGQAASIAQPQRQAGAEPDESPAPDEHPTLARRRRAFAALVQKSSKFPITTSVQLARACHVVVSLSDRDAVSLFLGSAQCSASQDRRNPFCPSATISGRLQSLRLWSSAGQSLLSLPSLALQVSLEAHQPANADRIESAVHLLPSGKRVWEPIPSEPWFAASTDVDMHGLSVVVGAFAIPWAAAALRTVRSLRWASRVDGSAIHTGALARMDSRTMSCWSWKDDCDASVRIGVQKSALSLVQLMILSSVSDGHPVPVQFASACESLQGRLQLHVPEKSRVLTARLSATDGVMFSRLHMRVSTAERGRSGHHAHALESGVSRRAWRRVASSDLWADAAFTECHGLFDSILDSHTRDARVCTPEKLSAASHVSMQQGAPLSPVAASTFSFAANTAGLSSGAELIEMPASISTSSHVWSRTACLSSLCVRLETPWTLNRAPWQIVSPMQSARAADTRTPLAWDARVGQTGASAHGSGRTRRQVSSSSDEEEVRAQDMDSGGTTSASEFEDAVSAGDWTGRSPVGGSAEMIGDLDSATSSRHSLLGLTDMGETRSSSDDEGDDDYGAGEFAHVFGQDVLRVADGSSSSLMDANDEIPDGLLPDMEIVGSGALTARDRRALAEAYAAVADAAASESATIGGLFLLEMEGARLELSQLAARIVAHCVESLDAAAAALHDSGAQVECDSGVPVSRWNEVVPASGDTSSPGRSMATLLSRCDVHMAVRLCAVVVAPDMFPVSPMGLVFCCDSLSSVYSVSERRIGADCSEMHLWRITEAALRESQRVDLRAALELAQDSPDHWLSIDRVSASKLAAEALQMDVGNGVVSWSPVVHADVLDAWKVSTQILARVRAAFERVAARRIAHNRPGAGSPEPGGRPSMVGSGGTRPARPVSRSGRHRRSGSGGGSVGIAREDNSRGVGSADAARTGQQVRVAVGVLRILIRPQPAHLFVWEHSGFGVHRHRQILQTGDGFVAWKLTWREQSLSIDGILVAEAREASVSRTVAPVLSDALATLHSQLLERGT
jgi:hypothetical protein